jgi:hypothetical protein
MQSDFFDPAGDQHYCGLLEKGLEHQELKLDCADHQLSV